MKPAIAIVPRATKRVRGGSGLGDSIYLRPIVDHFVSRGDVVQVCSDHPDVFIDSGATIEPFGRRNINVLAHYVAGKSDPNTNQWQDICRSAGFGIDDVPLSMSWKVRNKNLIDQLLDRAKKRPIILVHGGRTPMGRSDGFGLELLPDQQAFDIVLGTMRGCFTLRIGKGANLYPLLVSEDINDTTTVSDLLDVASICDGVIAQCSFAIPLAEIFGKQLLCVWAASGMAEYRHPYIKSITPQKVLSKTSSSHVMDSWSQADIQKKVRAFFWP